MKRGLFAIFLFIIGFSTGSYVNSTPSGSAPAPASTAIISTPAVSPTDETHPLIQSLENRVIELDEQLQQAQLHRQQLEEQLQRLETQFTTFANEQQLPDEHIQVGDTSEREAAFNNEDAEQENSLHTQLIEAGFSDTEIEDITSQEDQLALEKLYLRDRAMREDWLNSDRYLEAVRELDQNLSLKTQLGETRYDQYLYASGQFNRVKIENTLNGSAAFNAGIQQGDVLLRYDNERIFSWREIRAATTTGTSGESILVEVLRDGETLQFTIPRGPLGVRLNMERVNPEG